MEIINLDDVKEYCEKNKVDRNEWVADAIDKVLAGNHAIRYRNTDNRLALIDLRYLHSHMQSLPEFDLKLTLAITNNSFVSLNYMARKQAMLTIGELADDFEIGIA